MRYQLQSEQGNFSFRPKIFTEAIKVIISTNIIIFLLKIISQDPSTLFFNPVVDLFGLSPGNVWPRIWQPFTYLFIHKDFLHVFFNMFVLFHFIIAPPTFSVLMLDTNLLIRAPIKGPIKICEVFAGICCEGARVNVWVFDL